jgi:CheY-like chemotaxis protein/tetratricopeptide (TPR) repeat protein
MSYTVLYIDDSFELPERVEEILARAGYVLVYTSDPDEALRIAVDDRPALILIEVLLAERDGFDLIRSIHDAAIAPPLPIVVVTNGERSPQLYGQAIELGVEDFICKPVVGAQILEAALAFASTDAMDAPQAEASIPAVDFFEGNLEDQPLPQLFGRLHRGAASGVLTLNRDSNMQSVQLRNGSPIEVGRHGNTEPVADYLRRTGRIDDVQYEMLVDHLMARLGGPRQILMGMEALSGAQLSEATQEQAHGILLEMFDWASGRFSFEPNQQLTCAETLEVVCDPAKIVIDGLKRTADDLIHAALNRRSALYASASENSASRLQGLDLSPKQRSMIESLVGDRTVAEILSSRLLNERTLYGLYATGSVLLDEAPVLMLDQELVLEEIAEVPRPSSRVVAEMELPEPEIEPESQPEPELEIEPEADPELEIEFESVSESEPELDDESEAEFELDVQPESEPDPELEIEPEQDRAMHDAPSFDTAVSMIDEIAERLDSEDDFELFEICNVSRDGDVRAAYDRLLRNLPLDDISDEQNELRTRARALRVRLDQAYQRVRTADNRSAFAGLRKKMKKVDRREEIDGSRGVDAESWFRRGQGYLAHDDFEQAVEAFGMAVHLDPDQGDYAAFLGYSLYRKHPNSSVMRREALEHVAKGVKLAPGREKPLLFLSRIFRETGDASMAGKILRRALEFNPDSPALVQEMCLVKKAGPKSKREGFFGRLGRR